MASLEDRVPNTRRGALYVLTEWRHSGDMRARPPI